MYTPPFAPFFWSTPTTATPGAAPWPLTPFFEAGTSEVVPTFSVDGDVRVSRYVQTRIGASPSAAGKPRIGNTRSTAPKKRIG